MREMLELVVPSDINEGWDEIKGEFIYEELNKPKTIMLEHSLVSLSKWESLWKKRYFPVENRTIDEIVSYIQCMTITKNVEPEVYDRLIHHQDLINRITEYINDPMTATTFGKNQNDNSTRTENISSELIYFWMFDNGIPMECEKWHLNRLLTLIRVCNVKRGSGKKMSQSEIMRQYKSINEANRAKFRSKG
jgi:hypothetical protein